MKRYYVETNQMQPSPSELNALYILRKYNIIDDEVMDQIKFIIDGKVVKSQKEKKLEQMMGLPNIAIPQTNAVSENRTFDDLSPNIQKFCKTVKSYIAGRQACKSCTLINKEPVIIDTNLKEVGPVDIMVIGLNPGNDEKEAGVPFAGTSGQILRRLLNPIIERLNLTFVMTNVILCSTVNESEVKKPTTVYNNCKQILDEITKQFNPKLKIVLGAQTLKLVGIKGGITKLNGKVIDGYFVMIHPQDVIQRPNVNLPKIQSAFLELEKVLSGNTKFESDRIIPVAPAVSSIPQDKIVSRFSPNLSLFDIRQVDEQLIYILKDKSGAKKYLIESVQFPIFVKNGKYSECSSFDSSIQAVAHVTSAERAELNKALYHNLRKNMKL
jgi:uracil-DNA glycosylase family 4